MKIGKVTIDGCIIKLYLKRIVAILCVSILTIYILQGFRYILVDDTSSYTRITINEMYNSEENIDVIFVGGSHCYRSVVPEILDGYMGKYTYNLGTSSQNLDGSLALIKETIKHHNVDEIYLEVYYVSAFAELYKERQQLTKTYIISDYMKPSFDKVEYLLEASSPEHYLNSFIVARRKWEKIIDANYIAKMITNKSAETYVNYEWVKSEDDTEYYYDRGFVANEEVLPSAICWNDGAWNTINTDSVSEDWKKSLNEIIELCEEEDIKLTLFVAPMPQSLLIGKMNYDDYVDYISSIATENQIEYYDFNLCKDEYFSATNHEYFMDSSHLNTEGAVNFSNVFGLFVSGNISKEELFYSSFEEKLSMQDPMILGIAGPKELTSEEVCDCKILSNRMTGMEYKIVITPEGGEPRLIQDYSEEYKFSIPIDEHGIITIEWRCLDENVSQTIEIAY